MSASNLFVSDARSLPLRSDCLDTIITSPPYWQLRDYNTPEQIGNELTPQKYIESLLACLAEFHRVLRQDGNVFIVIGDKYTRTGGVDRKVRGTGKDPGGRVHARQVQKGVPGVADGALLGLPYRLAIGALSQGWLWRQNIVWHKPNPLPESVRRRCVQSHETVLHLTKIAQHFAIIHSDRGGACGHNVWNVPTAGYKDPCAYPTPAVFPVPLVQRMIATWCPPNGILLDPFVGSGSTAVAAKQMSLTHPNLQFIGSDIDKSMLNVVQRRLHYYKNRDSA